MAILSMARWMPGAAAPPVWAPIEALAALPLPDAESVLLVQARLEPEAPADEEARFLHFLHRTDRVRLDRYRIGLVRRRFLVGRGLVRAILGRTLGRTPLAVPLVEGDHGKPTLDPASCPDPIWFNLSHSGAVVLTAFTRGAELGVDVEQICSRRLLAEIQARYFHPDEQAVVRNDADFTRCWSLKEAVIKALGRGLGYPTDSFSVAPLLHGEPDMTLALEGRRWHCAELPVDDGYAAAIVIEDLH